MRTMLQRFPSLGRRQMHRCMEELPYVVSQYPFWCIISKRIRMKRERSNVHLTFPWLLVQRPSTRAETDRSSVRYSPNLLVVPITPNLLSHSDTRFKKPRRTHEMASLWRFRSYHRQLQMIGTVLMNSPRPRSPIGTFPWCLEGNWILQMSLHTTTGLWTHSTMSLHFEMETGVHLTAYKSVSFSYCLSCLGMNTLSVF
jgi:hypothetical protein